jgi:HEAT repeat protein
MKKLTTIFMAVFVMARVAGADVWEDLAKYKMSEEAEPPPVAIHKIIIETPVAEQGSIEDKLIAIIESKDATGDAKMFSCRMLQRVGSEKCVPVLAKLLCDDTMSHYARLTLERMKDSKAAGEALRNGLSKAPDKLKVGIASSLGERGDTKAVKYIAKLAESSCEASAKAALIALGKIGGKDAKKALGKMKVCDAAKGARQDARLSVAVGMKDAKTLEDIYKTAKCYTHRGAAISGLLTVDEGKGAALVAEVIKGDDIRLSRSAMRFATTLGGEKLTKAVAGTLNDLSAEKQVAVITLLGRRGDKSGLGVVEKYLAAEDKSVKKAAISATARLGNASTVSKLLACGGSDREINDAAKKSIAGMTDPAVNGALIKMLGNADTKGKAIEALSARNAVDAVPELKKLIADSDANVRKSAWTALGVLAGKDDLDELMKVSLTSKDKSDIRSAKDCMKNICGRSADKDGCVEILGAYFEKADGVTKAFILDMAAVTGSGKGLQMARQALKSSDKDLCKNAVRAMAAWSDAKPAKDLLEQAKNSPDETIRILALRGYIQMIGMDRDRNRQIEKLNAAKAIVKRVEEKRLLISVATQVRDNNAVAEFLAGFVDDASVKVEARDAFADKARHYKGKATKELIATLNTIANDANETKKNIKNAKEALSKIKRFKE